MQRKSKTSISVTNAHHRWKYPVGEVIKISSLVAKGETKKKVSASIVLTDHPQTIHINKKYLHHSGTTDVISFCYESSPVIECEIFVNLDQAREQCTFYETSARDEVRRLIVHGLLHVFGYDDRTAGGRKKMHDTEDKYLGRFGSGKNKA